MSSSTPLRRTRRAVRSGIRVTVLALFVGLLVLFFGTVSGVFMILGFGPVIREFTQLSGGAAKDVLLDSWPSDVSASDVRSMDFRLESHIDGHSGWYRIKLNEDAAGRWENAAHGRQESLLKEARSRSDTVEAVHRQIGKPPPMDESHYKPPVWWSPPEIPFRATEGMLFSGSRRAQASYTAFDADTQTLWIYECSLQHHVLWEAGRHPDGTEVVVF